MGAANADSFNRYNVRVNINRFENLKQNNIIDSPIEKSDVNELITSARLSKHATHVFIGTHGIIASNPQCAYLPWFASDPEKPGYESIMFDKDDSLSCPFDEINVEDFDYMNECFNKWKEANYVGNLSDYCVKFSDHFAE